MISGINVTPLVDIILVLLVVYMVTAKVVTISTVPMDLPQASAGESTVAQIRLQLPDENHIVMEGKNIDSEKEFIAQIRQRRAENSRVVIEAHGDVSHRRVIEVMDRLRKMGIFRIAFGVTVDSKDAAP